MHKCIGSQEMYPTVLRELADKVAVINHTGNILIVWKSTVTGKGETKGKSHLPNLMSFYDTDSNRGHEKRNALPSTLMCAQLLIPVSNLGRHGFDG